LMMLLYFDYRATAKLSHSAQLPPRKSLALASDKNLGIIVKSIDSPAFWA
jgi:hypothetical protein